MKLPTLISATLMLVSVAFLAMEIMTGNVVYWILGMTFFIVVGFRLLDLESKDYEQQTLEETTIKR